MARFDWRSILLSLFVVFIISMGYYANIVTIEQDLGTKNVFQLQKGDATDSSEDVLANVSFVNGGENLSWNNVQLSVEVEGQEFSCMVGGMSSVEQSNGTIQSTLNADGKTFTVNIDTNGEETQEFDFFTMRAAGNLSLSWIPEFPGARWCGVISTMMATSTFFNSPVAGRCIAIGVMVPLRPSNFPICQQ